MACSATVAALAASLGLSGCETARPATPGLYVPLASAGAVLDARTARDMISAYRRNKGAGELALDPDLQRLAEVESGAMARSGRPSSADAVKAKARAAGFRRPEANLSAGYHTLAEAFSGWRESAQHDRVMLARGASRMGIAMAYAPGSKYKVYWALVVGER